jgi:GcrA cell cycle regulator
MSGNWTPARVQRLRELWAAGRTASAIAQELRGVSRNAVIGKAHRLGLEPRPSPITLTLGDALALGDARSEAEE